MEQQQYKYKQLFWSRDPSFISTSSDLKKKPNPISSSTTDLSNTI